MKKIALITLFAASAMLSQGALIHTGLINYWNMDGNANDTAGSFAEATSSQVDNGTVEGTAGTVSFATGLFGGGVDFERSAGTDGRIQVLDGAGNDVDRTGLDVSISLWVQHDSGDSQQTGWQALLAHGEGSDYRIARDSGGGNISGPAYAGGGSDIRDLSGNNVYDGSWFHIVATTANGGATELYVNGVNVVSGTATGINDNGTNNLWIGNNPQGGANRMWDGMIDDVAMWDRVLTPAEASEIYSFGTGGVSLGAIPEPATGLLGALAGLLALGRRRR